MSNQTDLDPRVIRTRQLLTEAFSALIQEKTFQAMTVQDITNQAGVNRATFYAHFEDKYALLDFCINMSFEETLKGYLSPEATFSPENMRLLILASCDYLKRFNSNHCPSSARQVTPVIEKAAQTQIYEIVLKWIYELQKELPQPVLSPRGLASAISWAIFGVGVHWSRNEAAYELNELANEILLLLTDGLSGTFESAPLQLEAVPA